MSRHFCGSRQKRLSQVVDESLIAEARVLEERPRRRKLVWKVVKAPVALVTWLLGAQETADLEDDEADRDVLRDARLRVWFRSDPSLADRHYMMVQSGMRYSFFLY